MFELLVKDLSQAPLAYTVMNGVEAFATKVKLSLAIPWLEIVCGKKNEEEIFLISNTLEYERFAQEDISRHVASIACRVLERSSGKLNSVELCKVVVLEDEVSIRFEASSGVLLHPFTLEPDKRNEITTAKVLFEVNTKIRQRTRGRKSADSGVT